MKKDIKSKILLIVVIVFIILVILALVTVIAIKSMQNNENITEENEVTNDISENPEGDNSIDENIIDNQDQTESNISYVETSDGSKIPVPEGFEYVEGTKSQGAVIQDENGNQFVFVSLDGISYIRRTFENPYTATDENETNKEATSEEVEYKESENEVYTASVTKYQGFYIGRYEASKNQEDDNKANTIKGVTPWTEITYSQMQDVAQNTYAENPNVISDLPSSYAWDSLCTWLSDSGYNIYNSTSYGNYTNNVEGTRKISCYWKKFKMGNK